jgi:hypothetical protein
VPSQELLDAIEQSLGQAVTPSVSASTAAYDLFEVFIFTLIVEAARNMGANVVYQNIGSSSFNNQFTFRTSPGYIYSRAQPYTYARMDFGNQAVLEAHIGIYATGVSRVRHECDVAVLKTVDAENCRINNVHPRGSDLWLATECKFYASQLGLDLGRSFLGLMTEIHRHSRFFVTNSSSTSVEKLLAHHKMRWQVNVLPINTDIVNRLRTAFENVFQDFLAVQP